MRGVGFTKTNIFLTDTVQEVVAETEEGHEAQQNYHTQEKQIRTFKF